MIRIVIDTNIFLAAVLQPEKTCRSLLRLVLEGNVQALMGEALKCPISTRERDDLFNAFLTCCEWVNIYYLWRPNLRDEADNHLVDLAVAGQAEFIITRNIRDLTSGELLFDDFRIVTPEKFLKEYGKWEQ